MPEMHIKVMIVQPIRQVILGNIGVIEVMGILIIFSITKIMH